MEKKIDRRHFLKATGAASTAAITIGAAAQQSSNTINSASELSIAEKLAGVNFTDTERAMVYDRIEGMMDRTRLRRAGTTINNDDAPAMVFDPRLAGENYKTQSNTVRLNGEQPRALPSDEDVAFASISEQGHWLRSGQLTASRLLDIYLTRIRKHGPKLECFITLMEDSARAEAYSADSELRAGRDRGPLHGIPYGMKDLADAAGVPSTWGAEPYKGRVPSEDAVIVKRLRDAGAVLIGKTSLGALAYGDRWFGGTTRNPWNTDEGSSGSSAGSASSTAAALVSFSIGTETLGSIVSPSNRCGTTGLRPTFGRVPRTGAMALCWSLDKFGPICRHVDDTALVLAAINGADDGDPSSIDWGFEYDAASAVAQDIVLGYDPAWFEGSDVTTSEKQAFTYAKELGFKTKEISIPELPYGSLISILEVEAAAAFEELTLSDRDDLMKWQEPRAWPNTFRAAHLLSAVEVMQVDRFRRQVMQVYADLFKQVDVVLCPHYRGSMLLNTNYTGNPCLIIPAGLEQRVTTPLNDGSPVEAERPTRAVPHGFTLWGNMFREDQLIAVGSLLERQIGFKAHRPKL
ncbi:amidase [Kordiimonas aquimaris]|uniref:amidase n=1 Tax=Kordiimonas aquimaris TaxID=707591 RepID=UPI0021D02665|nr:amidase [Kordiimonas aquimaris]